MGRAKDILCHFIISEVSFTKDEVELLNEWKELHDSNMHGGLNHKM